MIRLAICRGQFMKRFVEGADRGQSTLLPECLDEWVEESNSVRVVDSFVDGLDLADLGFEGVEPAVRPACLPPVAWSYAGVCTHAPTSGGRGHRRRRRLRLQRAAFRQAQ
jgi:hypothetical protein